jgi:hypothetical protein
VQENFAAESQTRCPYGHTAANCIVQVTALTLDSA